MRYRIALMLIGAVIMVGILCTILGIIALAHTYHV